MDDWQPITDIELQALLLKEISEFEPMDQTLWSQHRAPIRSFPIFRSAASGIEQVFVVAQINQHVLFFDDVEDEFAVARVSENNPINDYGLYGELRYALRGLAERAA